MKFQEQAQFNIPNVVPANLYIPPCMQDTTSLSSYSATTPLSEIQTSGIRRVGTAPTYDFPSGDLKPNASLEG